MNDDSSSGMAFAIQQNVSLRLQLKNNVKCAHVRQCSYQGYFSMVCKFFANEEFVIFYGLVLFIIYVFHHKKYI